MDVADSRTPVYHIGTVSRLTGLSQRQIRYYDKLGLLTPFRSQGGHRLYSQDDLDDLLFIGELLKKGYSMREVGEAMSGRPRAKREEPVRPLSEMDASFRFNSISEPSSLFPVMKRPEVLKRIRPRQKPASHGREDERK